MTEVNYLYEYIRDPENPETNFNLAEKYLSIGQTAAAISFFLRCADRSGKDLDLAYECLINIGMCFDKQGNRFEHVRSMYRRAISTLPKRPEAYYMLANFENWHKQFGAGYTLCCQALEVCDLDSDKELRLSSRYPGKWGLIYEKAVSSWWNGKNQETRNLYHALVKYYWEELDDYHKEKVKDHFTRLGVTPFSQSRVGYIKEQHESLRFKFNGSESIEHNYSQVMQDMFVLSALNGKRNGTFLEIGSSKPFERNNTALLEMSFGWDGIAIEIDDISSDEYVKQRPNIRLLQQDALTVDYSRLLSEQFEGNVIDYLQLDIEPSKNTYDCMLKIPFDDYKFAVITYEHDYYLDIEESYRQKSRDFLESKGYVMVVNDISPEGISTFEDWWVHPDLVDKNIIEILYDVSSEIKNIKSYMLNS